MKIDFAARVEIGPKETNDDRALVGGQILDMAACSGSFELPAVVAVCDGCGGYAGGGIAAQTVLELLSRETPGALSDPDALSRVLRTCQDAVMEKKRAMPQYAAMCTTIAGCVLCNDSILLFHAGDSRVYRYDGWGLARMTIDHSVVQGMVDMGQITEEEALTNPHRNVINRCIGMHCPPPEIYVSHGAMQPGETYVLCSDGLWESVRDAEITQILSSGVPLPQMADTLVQRALEQGAEDNISVCICSAQGEVTVTESKPFILD